MYIVLWKRLGESFINREYCQDLEEAKRRQHSHLSCHCEFCHIEKGE